VEGDTERPVAALRQLGRPVLGLIENMSYYHCSQCGREEQAEGSGAVRRVAESLGIGYLGATPISVALRDGMAEGRPGDACDWDASDAVAFQNVTANFRERALCGGYRPDSDGARQGAIERTDDGDDY
jgi:ATP-binding protein involved in chromosome partitioning